MIDPVDNIARCYPWPIIGLVGGIGSGKSAVADMFAELGCEVVNSDKAAHEALHDADVKAAIIAAFGSAILDDRGEIDRRRLGAMVFSDPQKLSRLNALVHPYVAAYRDQRIEMLRHNAELPGVVFDSPLLIESGLHRRCNAVVFVHCGDAIRFSRVQKSRGWSEAEWKKREAAQYPLDKKVEISHYIVSNEVDMPRTAAQVNWALTCITRDFQRSHGLRGMVS
ncbi:MAG: dephospho-CoA kinase [Phycisphaerae bacterium]